MLLFFLSYMKYLYCNYSIFLIPLTTGCDLDLQTWGVELSVVIRVRENGTALVDRGREKDVGFLGVERH